MENEIPEEFWQAVDQFNAQDFYACHDTLEALWMDAVEPDKKFYQGILQIAVSLYHLGNLNWRGAAILLGEGMSLLGYYYPEYYTINVEKLITESQEILWALQQSGPDNVAEFAQHLLSSDGGAVGGEIARLPVPKLVKRV